jgi:hypothetical protein
MDFPSRPVDALPANRHVYSERAHGQHDTLFLEDRRTAETETLDDGVHRLYETQMGSLQIWLAVSLVLIERTAHLFTGNIESV